MSACGEWCHLESDAIAAAIAPHEPPRQLRCERQHPHKGPHLAEGWEWDAGRIWLVGQCPWIDTAAARKEW